jgi:MoxR-like ATPase
MEFIATDPVTMLQVDAAVRDMGNSYISALLLEGPPGCGKTYLAKYLAHKLSAEFILFQFFPGASREDLLLDLALGANGQRAPGVLLTAMRQSKEKKVVLLLDELDKADVRVDAFLLTLLNEASLLIPQIGQVDADSRNLLMVIAKNDQRDASGPLLRRCRCVFMAWPKPEIEVKILQQKLPTLSAEACLCLIDTSNILRKHVDVKKKPSTAELIRIAGDLLHLVQQKTEKRLLGEYFITTICPLEQDRARLTQSPIYYGTEIAQKFSGQ